MQQRETEPEDPMATLREKAEQTMASIRAALEAEDLQEATFYANLLLEMIRAERFEV